MKANAELADDNEEKDNYLAVLYGELNSGHTRPEREIVHNVNTNLGAEGNEYRISETITAITDACDVRITCDMYYELDWYYRLRYAGTCTNVEEDEPCFGTFACVCDNGYFRLLESMPERPEDVEETGLEEVLNEVEEA